MFSKFVLVILMYNGGIDHIEFPYRAECEYAAKKINEAGLTSETTTMAKAFCFDVIVQGDRHEPAMSQ